MPSIYEDIVSHLQSTGFFYQGSMIYGGLANTWDYGPLGCLMKNNIKNAWWQRFIVEEDNVGLDSAIMLNPRVWEASGHISNFSDPLIDCRVCKQRFRADQLLDDVSGINDAELEKRISLNAVCPKCGSQSFTPIRRFNLMFETKMGAVVEQKSNIYLRPETAQGIFINFNNIARTSRKKLPFGVGQIGKAFRNEITPGNFIFRVREFEQMELEFFLKPGDNDQWYRYYQNACLKFLGDIGIKKDKIRLREHGEEELAHYSNQTCDIEYLFPFGWGEVWGISDRGDFDLKSHNKLANVKLDYFDPDLKVRIIPHVVEPSLGVERCFLMAICDAYDVEVENDNRIVLRLSPILAPIKCAILPLDKKLAPQAEEFYKKMSKNFQCAYDEAGSIGKRYRRQDAIGTPFCITFDHESATDNMVTIRYRDDMRQERILIEEVAQFVATKVRL